MTKHYSLELNSNEEVFSSEFSALLKELNSIVVESKVPLEGNLFYLNHRRRERPIDATTDRPDSVFRNKRLNFVTALRTKRKLVEIGFNAGHSALLALLSNPQLSYIGIDIARYAYTKPCAAFLVGKFSSRVEVAFGDSAKVFPLLALEKLLDCDIIHIDGGHSLEMFTIDIAHAIMLPNPDKLDRHILVDDAGAPHILEKISALCKAGYLAQQTDVKPWRGRENLLLKIISR